MISYGHIEELQDKLDSMKQRYLEVSGWERSCENPRCVWLWVKEIEGERFTLSTDGACSMQQAIDASDESI